ncbi:hypothetical protein PM082_015615 [Marasmius tenuissimus]|nr:hypothetical protein PM082_015615 [Marasmius tenuissimus]
MSRICCALLSIQNAYVQKLGAGWELLWRKNPDSMTLKVLLRFFSHSELRKTRGNEAHCVKRPSSA